MESNLARLLDDYLAASQHEGTLPDAGLHLRSRNPICGDELTLDVVCDEGVIRKVRFTHRGCLVSRAFAAALCDVVANQRIGRVSTTSFETLFEVDPSSLSPHRQYCAKLAFDTLKNGLKPFNTSTL